MDVLAEVTRSGLVESRHRGVAVLVDHEGRVAWSIGDPTTTIFPRSANKPFQALGMLRAGLPLEGRLLALASASHSGESFHLAGVREILALAGLDESALQTPASYPLDRHEHAALLRAGGERAPILMDCSGKHAAMLLTCVQRGWDTATYLEPEHPVQQHVAAAFADLVGPPPVVGVDGCGAPLLAASVADLAAGVGRLMGAAHGPEHAVVRAMVEHPEQVSGTRRPDLALASAVPGSLVKSGAESVVVVGLADGSAVAVKVEDGGERALFVIAHRVLELAGVDAALLQERPEVLGGGRPVGQVRPAF
ncbi:asparaginase [Aeromicrobium sp. CF4.19]|uniref:asparaginase n=1 Tax=Aeromicrobium sp. CF4.19 TaxID=3373082 RepID=UPI003EE61A5E